MNALKLHIDEFDDNDFHLIAIHTQLDDYRLAYYINKVLAIHLSKSKKEISIQNKNGETNFSRFFYEDIEKDIYWDLFKNKSRILNTEQNNQDLFGQINAKFSTNMYLLPEYKKVDFFLKIDSNDTFLKNNEMLSLVNSIDRVSTVYSIDIDNLKSKNNLIF